VTAALHNDRGWTLVELLVAMTLMLIVLSATLTSFNAFSNNSKRNFDFNDQQDQVRTTLDTIVRQARNLANPTTGAAGSTFTTIAYAGSDRLVFQTTDPQKQWVSYCLDSTTPTRGVIWYQTTANNTLTPNVVNSGSATGSNNSGPMVQGCPSQSPNWSTQLRVGDFVTNRANNQDRPLFSYFATDGPVPTVPVPLADTSKVVRVGTSVFMKLDPNRAPAETELASAAYMRNQNQPPTSSFVATVSGGSNYTFDAGASLDAEGRTLLYDWYTAPTNVATVPTNLPSCSAAKPDFTANPTWDCLGTTVVIRKTISTATNVFLRVTDPGALTSMSTLPSGGCASAVSASRTPTTCGALP
jgi:prepilin-type N-terminal cleavage/methylation domain-containing protein